MKHSENQINERLRKALADRFKTIHDEPDPALAKIILGSISSRNPFVKPVRFALMALLTIFISIAVDDQRLPAGLHRKVGKRTEMQSDKVSLQPEYHSRKEQVNRSIKKGITWYQSIRIYLQIRRIKILLKCIHKLFLVLFFKLKISRLSILPNCLTILNFEIIRP